MSINLRDRTTLWPPRRLQASNSSEDKIEQVDKLVINTVSSNNSSSTSISDETENLAALREELENLDTSLFGFDNEGIQDQHQHLPIQNLRPARMAMTRFELDPYMGDINLPRPKIGNYFWQQLRKETMTRSSPSSKITQSSSWKLCSMIPTNFAWNCSFIWSQ